MREDQYQRMKELSEKLADAFILEADPDDWPGAGLKPNQMTQVQERCSGNRHTIEQGDHLRDAPWCCAWCDR